MTRRPNPSVPPNIHRTLSLTIIQEYPRRLAIASSSRATRSHDIELSTTVARHSRLKSSMTHRMRKPHPSTSVSDAKSSDHLWVGSCGIAIGARTQGPPPVTAFSDRQTLFLANPAKLPPVHCGALALQQQVQTPVPPLARLRNFLLNYCNLCTFSGQRTKGRPSTSV